MRSKITQYRIQRVWHFTDKANFSLIDEHGGLLSLREIINRDITVPVFGGNEWSHEADVRCDVDRYVHLCFLSNHPMLFRAKEEGRITQPVWLGIKVDIIFQEGVMFTDDVSNKSGVSPMDATRAANEIDFEVLFTRTDWTDPVIQERRQKGEKSEILVPDFIPIEMIERWRDG